MSKNSTLLGAITRSSITVGYIDPTLGYVDNVSINDANKYAQNNPGTIFIFIDGDNTLRFLNINEVNSLKTSDIVSKKDKCDTTAKKCGPPLINFFGGGGVGATANPIIGTVGSLLAVDIISGGYGYRFPPKVEAIDDCQFGSGAVLRSRLGETSTTFRVFDTEDDVEEYVIEEDESESIVEWGPDGEPLGEWNADDYDFDNQSDPIRDEIERFQRTVIETPFWSTRKNKPTRITSLDQSYSTSYDVVFPSWNEFMNTYAISPVPPSDFPGSDFSGRIFTFEWVQEFPYEGIYTFNGLCDNVATVYIDDDLVVENLNGFNQPVSSFSRSITEGFHTIRVDLLNIPVQENQPVSVSSKVDVTFRVYGQGRNCDKMKVSFTSQDGKDSFTLNGSESSGKSRKDIIRIRPNVNYNVSVTSIRGQVEQGTISNGTKNKEGGLIESNKIFGDHIGSDNDNDDVQITAESGIFKPSNKKEQGGRSTYKLVFRVDSDAPSTAPSNTVKSSQSSISTRYSIPKIKISEKKGQYYIEVEGEGTVKAKVKMDINDNPFTNGIAASEIVLPTDAGNVSFKRTLLGKTDTFTSSFLSYKEKETITKNVVFTGGKKYGPIEIIGSSSGQRLNGSKRLDLFDQDGQDANIRFEIFSIEPTKQSDLLVDSVISPISWNQNPMGISLTIDAPIPPTPKEPLAIVNDTRCPPNPIWSTRFSNSTESWYPVRFDEPNTWSKFMNRYAVSPVLPLNTPGSDTSGITFSNTWDVNIPFDGFYTVKGTADDFARVLIDGIEVKVLDGFNINNPSSVKVFITEGSHTITTEVLNYPRNLPTTIDKKIFSTQDWRNPTRSVSDVDVVFRVYGQGRNSNKLIANFTSENGKDSFTISGAKSSGQSRKDIVKVKPGVKYKVSITSIRGPVEQGTISNETKNKEGGLIESNKIFGDHIGSDNDNDDIQITTELGIFTPSNKRERGGRSTYNLVFYVDPNDISSGSVTTVGDVKYSGPPIFAHSDRRWSDFTNNYSVSPKVFTNISEPEPPVVGKYTLTWSNVDFPEDGTYKINFQADNEATLKIGGKLIKKVSDFSSVPVQYTANVTAGKYDVVVELENFERSEDDVNRNSYRFIQNPMAVALYISKDITFNNSTNTSWLGNPMGVSAVLISPPCPKDIGGRGVVEDVIVEDPGNGYLQPTPTGQNYPVTLELVDVIVTDPGINYNCGFDEIKIVPDNGAQLSYTCDSFGRIVDVTVEQPGSGFTSYPNIFMQTPTQVIGAPEDGLGVISTQTQPTGVNASFIPVFRVVRDPIEVTEDKLIQVTDLVGLKQTGYVNGRAYYGVVYYENGIRYAGYYKTTGTPIVVYNTLQESIAGRITTPASAIEVSGTDISTNDPRLNIPQTPQTTTEL